MNDQEFLGALRESLINSMVAEDEASEWARLLQRLRAHADPELQEIAGRIDDFGCESETVEVELEPDWAQTESLLRARLGA